MCSQETEEMSFVCIRSSRSWNNYHVTDKPHAWMQGHSEELLVTPFIQGEERKVARVGATICWGCKNFILGTGLSLTICHRGDNTFVLPHPIFFTSTLGVSQAQMRVSGTNVVSRDQRLWLRPTSFSEPHTSTHLAVHDQCCPIAPWKRGNLWTFFMYDPAEGCHLGQQRKGGLRHLRAWMRKNIWEKAAFKGCGRKRWGKGGCPWGLWILKYSFQWLARAKSLG